MKTEKCLKSLISLTGLKYKVKGHCMNFSNDYRVAINGLLYPNIPFSIYTNHKGKVMVSLNDVIEQIDNRKQLQRLIDRSL